MPPQSGQLKTETMNALAMITKAGVPSNQVVAGVTSYGRSFHMAEAGCYTSECLFSGSRTQSDAKKGPCTNTAGYVSDAEINDIISNSSRVNHNFVVEESHSNILVYDDTQWVGWMSRQTRSERQAIYESLNLGGTSNWASDLETFNDPPYPSDHWLSFKLSIKIEGNPNAVGERTGNWTELGCDNEYYLDRRHLTPSQRWNGMDAPHAWKDLINAWIKHDKGKRDFVESISLNLNGAPMSDCGSLLADSNCDQTQVCNSDQLSPSNGVATFAIWNSFVIIHDMYQSYYDTLFDSAASVIDNALSDLENKFAPIPPEPDNSWLLLLLDLVTLGISSAAGPFFNTFLSKMSYFTAGSLGDNVKDITMTVVGQSTTIAKDLLNIPKNKWDEQKQDKFSNYMGQAIDGWGNVTSLALKHLINGRDGSIETLTDLISDGKLIAGNDESPPLENEDETANELRANIAKSFFAFSIPSLWTVSKTYAFVIDSGYNCGEVDPLGDYLDEDTMHATAACYDGKLYYPAQPKGDSQTCEKQCYKSCQSICHDSKFSAPPGIDSLDGSAFGGITVKDLITESICTYQHNGNTNGGGVADPSSGETAEDLMGQDVTTLGFIRLPVCSPERAFKTWDTAGAGSGSSENYPCSVPNGPDRCSDSTFVDQTSDASPLVSDCKTSIKNIEGDGGATWEIENAIGQQHQIVQAGECKFSVQGMGKDGNIDFHVSA